MQDVATGGRTVLFVSHNMGAVSALCSQGIVLSKGIIKLKGTAYEAIKKYSENENSNTKIQRCNKKNKEIFLSEATAFYDKEKSQIKLKIKIISTKCFKISIECCLLDTQKNPLAFLSKGRMNTLEKIKIKEGDNYFFYQANLPCLFEGIYYLKISIADPLICFLDICEELLEIKIERNYDGKNNYSLNPNLSYGHIEIPLRDLNQIK